MAESSIRELEAQIQGQIAALEVQLRNVRVGQTGRMSNTEVATCTGTCVATCTGGCGLEAAAATRT